ncbi:MAG: hypothetical protein AAF408_03845 [Pseudomonadota bacterium]
MLTRTAIGGGDIVLAAPEGYCIDRRSVRRDRASSFAVLARCDTLGARGFFEAQDQALITVITEARPQAKQPTKAGLSASSGGTVTATRVIGGQPFIRVSTANHKVQGASAQHWRTALALNGHLIGLALYARPGSDALDRNGAIILADLSRETQPATSAKANQTTLTVSGSGKNNSNISLLD